ncbi:FkbM family methyltransferase [Candidatus Omnitrophota bacterium]
MSKILRWLADQSFKFISQHRIGKFYPVKAIWNLLFNRISLPLKSNIAAFETKCITKQIVEGNVVLDIGARVGYYTLIFSRLVGKEGKVFAFEPDPKNFALLQKNVQAKGCRNVVLIRKAVANKTGQANLYLSEHHQGDHRIYDSSDGRQSIKIESIRLDDFLKGYNHRINFIKIDVQGAEAGVIQGMARLLEENKELRIATEFWPLGLQQSGVKPEDFLRLFLDRGFLMHQIDEEKQSLQQIKISELLQRYTAEEDNQTDLLFTRCQR